MLCTLTLFACAQKPPIVRTYIVEEVYEWDSTISNFASIASEHKQELRIFSIAPDWSSMELKFVTNGDTIIINTEIVNMIDVEDPNGDYTAIFLLDKENYPYLVETRLVTGSTGLYMRYDTATTGYNGFLLAESLNEIK